MNLVLVHGGGFGGSCWELLLPYLDAQTFVVDLPGRGSRPAVLAGLTLADFTDAVVDDIVTNDLDDVVLVGHSLAGIVLPAVADRVPERLRRLVYVACAVPSQGESVADVLSTLSPQTAEVTARLGAGLMTEGGTLHPDLATAMFCNDMDAEQTDFTLSRLVPEAAGVISAPTDLAGLRQNVPATYVRLQRDASLTIATQDTMAANLGDPAVVDLDAGHMAMISQPAELAAILNAIVESA